MTAAWGKEDANSGETDDIAARSQKPLSNLLITYSYPSVGPFVRMEKRYSAGRVCINFCVSDFYWQMSTGTGFGHNYKTMMTPSHEDILTVVTESRCYWPL